MAEATYTWNGRATESSHRQAVERVILSMQHNLDTGMSLQEMAKAAFISPFHFNRIFHKLVGIPPSHFQSALRIQAAKRLLAATDNRVIDVCLDVGFTSPGTFSRRFKDFVGMSPRQFRRLAGQVLNQRLQPPAPSRFTIVGHPESPICGEISAPEGFSGPIFLGLFLTPLPYSRPSGCCYLERPGFFNIPRVPDGDYYLLALGFPDRLPATDYLLGETALRAGSTSQPVTIRDGRPCGSLDLHLRGAEITDPPILVTVPWLMEQRTARGPACDPGLRAAG